MKKSRFSEEKIISILREADAGVKVAELARKHGINPAGPAPRTSTGPPTTSRGDFVRLRKGCLGRG